MSTNLRTHLLAAAIGAMSAPMISMGNAAGFAASAFRRLNGTISRPGRRRIGWNSKNQNARDAGIPKAFRQYAKRYGSDVNAVIAAHGLLFEVQMLDHGRDRRNAFLKVFGAHK
jgi:hypothetical protein